MTSNLLDVHARQILDSRGNPTIEVEVYTDEFIGSAAVPSGASTGSHEALELRDGGEEYDGKGVQKAVANVTGPIKKALNGADVLRQEEIDERLIALDDTKNKSKLGANAMLGVSLAVSRAGSAANGVPLYEHLAALARNKQLLLPLPFANVINGGKHAGSDLRPQEFMIVPVGAKSVEEAIRIVVETYHALKKTIEARYGKTATNVGDEGGFAPPLKNAEEALSLLVDAVAAAGYVHQLRFAIDAAASEFYLPDRRLYEIEKGRYVTADQLGDYWLAILKKYPVVSLEDPFAEDDTTGWAQFMKKVLATPLAQFSAKLRPQIVGDDLTVTNTARIQHAIDKGLCSALLLKVNQIGTLSEAIRACQLARAAGWNVMVSNRSGETEDPYLADLAVGLGTGQIKLGAPCRSDRVAKYNQLLRISEELGKKARYALFPTG